MKLLLTAFEPFGGEEINAALEVSKRLPARVRTLDIVRLSVPTSFSRCTGTVLEAIGQEKPDFVLMLGQAAGRSALSVERVAINCMDARMADNDGNRPVDLPVVEGGPAAYFSMLSIKKMTEAIRAEGIDTSVSNSAGTFVCNALFYGVLHGLQSKNSPVKAGFLHVPILPEQAKNREKPTASMPLDTIVRGVEAAIRSLDGETP